MKKVQNYFWLIIVALYLILPWDLHPTLLDDLLVLGIYLYFLFYQMNKIKAAQDAYHRQKRHAEAEPGKEQPYSEQNEPMTLQAAYRILGVSPTATAEEIRKAFHKRVAENHPDKLNHMSRALRERANELTVMINRAYTMIKQHRNM